MTISEAAKATQARASLRASTNDLLRTTNQSVELLQGISGNDVAATRQQLGEGEEPLIACCEQATKLRQDFDQDAAVLKQLEAELAAAEERARKKRLMIIGAIVVFVIIILLSR